VAQALTRLKVSGFADVRPDGTYAFAPGSSRHREMAEAIETLSLQKPMTLIKATAEIPDEKLRLFELTSNLKSEAFVDTPELLMVTTSERAALPG